MITADLVYFRHGNHLGTFNHDGSPMRREIAEAHKAKHPEDPCALQAVAYCRVCGVPLDDLPRSKIVNSAGWRCERHQMSNPCAIEGCRRSTRGRPGWHGLELWLCGEHWRLGVPPRSPERRVYHRLFRLAGKIGWNAELNARFWRVWPRLVRQARARVAGDIDMDEISRLMGWD
jgi:hypothetical protein